MRAEHLAQCGVQEMGGRMIQHDGLAARCIDAGMDGLLVKPFTAEQLFDILWRVRYRPIDADPGEVQTMGELQ